MRADAKGLRSVELLALVTAISSIVSAIAIGVIAWLVVSMNAAAKDRAVSATLAARPYLTNTSVQENVTGTKQLVFTSPVVNAGQTPALRVNLIGAMFHSTSDADRFFASMSTKAPKDSDESVIAKDDGKYVDVPYVPEAGLSIDDELAKDDAIFLVIYAHYVDLSGGEHVMTSCKVRLSSPLNSHSYKQCAEHNTST